MVLGIQHLVRGGKPRFLQHLHVQGADGNNALEQVGRDARIGLMQHALITVAHGSGLVGIDAGNDQNFILDLLLHACKATDIIKHRCFGIG